MDVRAETVINASPHDVGRVMFDPANDPFWIGGAKAVEGKAPVGVGDRVRRHGGFLGRKFSWVTEATDFQPDRLLAMRFVEGPMKGSVSYEIEPANGGSHVTIWNRGVASFGFPGIGWLVRQGVQADLKRLKRLVETRASSG